MLSTLLLAIPLLFPSSTAAAAVVKKDVSSTVVVASEAALVDAAVTFTSFPSRSQCLSNQSGTRYANPDAGCYHLPGQSMDINGIAGGCRVFIYESENCDGRERQVGSGEICVDIESFNTIKVFCG
ncbi:uncharacterized protein J4E87_006849 [Alternaria ethzedia]|uniref:uncharacterized protein n=1 Tax=Alternaria ethzedia TaxID=181014 RepID=UPI0020C444C8|nr:uncharacterized protein J4E87_006849 [Alternaria ethzedia]KAI4621221.1 hypothetical protein J4E87_006849 [Alternaria ethzedia]